MVFGMEPEKLLFLRFKYSSLDNDGIHDGISPAKLLTKREMYLKRRKPENSGGKVPLKLLPLRSRETRKERFPRWGGMGPESSMLERLSPETLWWRELHVTPIQLQTGAVSLQFVVIVREGSEIV